MSILEPILSNITNSVVGGVLEPFNYYIFTVKTDNSGVSDNDQFSLPLISGGTYDFYIDWGDGVVEHITAYNQSEITHTYSSAGTYQIKIWKTLRGWAFDNAGDDEKIIAISQWGALDGEIADGFFGCSNLASITATDIPRFLNSTSSLVNLFRGCSLLSHIPNLEQWTSSTSNNIVSIIRDTQINQNISNLITSNITNMSNAIMDSNMDQDLSGGDFSGITDASGFADGTTMSTTNINALLNRLDEQLDSLNSGVTIGLGSAVYSLYGATAVYNLTTDKSWSISSGGLNISGSEAWFDGESLSGSSVDDWEDQFSNSNNATQVTASRRPLIVTDGDGYKAARFDGTSDFLGADSLAGLTSGPFTLFLVAKINSSTGTRAIFAWNDDDGDINVENYDFTSSGKISLFGGGTLIDEDVSGQIQIMSFSASDTDVVAHLNGVEKETATRTNETATTFAIGAEYDSGLTPGNYIDADYYEMIIFDKLLNSTERVEVETYLSNKRP